MAEKTRNRAAEAKGSGKVMRMFTLSAEADAGIDLAAEMLTTRLAEAGADLRPVSRVQALEWLIREWVKSTSMSTPATIPKKKGKTA